MTIHLPTLWYLGQVHVRTLPTHNINIPVHTLA